MPKISNATPPKKKSKNIKRINKNRLDHLSTKKTNNEILEKLLSAFDKNELLKTELFLNKLEQIDLNQVDLTITSPVYGGNLLSILCSITDKSFQSRVDDLIKTLLNRKDRERYINQRDRYQTPLQYLVERRQDMTVEQFEKLVQLGCHAGCKDCHGYDLLYSAVKASNFNLVLHLMDEYDLDFEPIKDRLYDKIARQKLTTPVKKIIDKLHSIKKNIYVDILYAAIRWDNFTLAHELIDTYPLDPQEITLNDIIYAPSKSVFTKDLKKIIDKLWSKKVIDVSHVNIDFERHRYADVRVYDNARELSSPLLRAIHVRNDAYIKWLLEHGAVFNMENSQLTHDYILRLTKTPKISEEENLCKALRVLQEKTFALHQEMLDTDVNDPKHQQLKSKLQVAEKSFDDLARAFILYLIAPKKTFAEA